MLTGVYGCQGTTSFPQSKRKSRTRTGRETGSKLGPHYVKGKGQKVCAITDKPFRKNQGKIGRCAGKKNARGGKRQGSVDTTKAKNEIRRGADCQKAFRKRRRSSLQRGGREMCQCVPPWRNSHFWSNIIQGFGCHRLPANDCCADSKGRRGKLDKEHLRTSRPKRKKHG